MIWVSLALAGDSSVARPIAGRPVAELRGGIDTTSGGKVPQLCGEVQVHRLVGVEACGTGAGILHQVPVDEMAHFRLEASLPVLQTTRTDLVVQPGVGFAEVQRGRDKPGFRFGPQSTPDQNEAAGAELALSVKARMWAHERAYVTTEVTAGSAYIPAAPTVLGGEPTVGFAGATVGIGF